MGLFNSYEVDPDIIADLFGSVDFMRCMDHGRFVALIHLLDLSSTTGWIIIGILSVLSVAAVLILRHEVLHAIELPDDVDLDYLAPDAAPSYGERQAHSPILPVDAAPAFRVSSQYY